LFTKEGFTVEIQNGEFVVTYKGKSLPSTKLQDYDLACDKWTHFTFTYRRKRSNLSVFINCEEVVNFQLALTEEIGLKGDLCFGNGGCDAELTEIRIWKEEIPIKLIKENYKSPLPIVSENKRKIRMKINKQDDQTAKKKFEFNKSNISGGSRLQSFAFGVKNDLRSSSTIRSEISDNNVSSNNNRYEFNPSAFNNHDTTGLYPSLSSILKEDTPKNENAENFNFKFEADNNNEQKETTSPWTGVTSDFNFDK
jgi:hypothetical protein